MYVLHHEVPPIYDWHAISGSFSWSLDGGDSRGVVSTGYDITVTQGIKHSGHVALDANGTTYVRPSSAPSANCAL